MLYNGSEVCVAVLNKKQTLFNLITLLRLKHYSSQLPVSLGLKHDTHIHMRLPHELGLRAGQTFSFLQQASVYRFCMESFTHFKNVVLTIIV